MRGDAPGGASPRQPLLRYLERYGAAVAGVLVLVGLALRLPGIFEYWLNPDEGIYYSSLTRASFGEFWTEVMANAHPPAYYLLLRGLGFLTWDFFWLRGMSVVFGVSAIWVFWLVGRELGGKGAGGVVAGLTTAALLTFNSEAITLSQIMRPYMLLVMLLGGALHFLLLCRCEPSRRNIAGYVVVTCLALLTHYSAMLALGVFTAVIAHDGLTGSVDRSGWKRLAASHAFLMALAVVLYHWHLAALLDSELMAMALEPGGWLSDWLIESPVDAWNSLRAFQVFHLPDGFQARSALVLISATIVSAVSRDRLVAVVTGVAVLGALAASFIGAYPLSPGRHSAWLFVFTMPALGWLVGHVIRSGRKAWLAAAVCVTILGVSGSRVEWALGGATAELLGGRNNSTEEQLIRWDDLARLVVERMDRETGPRIILSGEQTYHLLSPLYPADREELAFSADSSLFHFSYGRRDIVVARTWDWAGAEDVLRVLESLPEKLPALGSSGESEVLVLAGGWGSGFLTDVPVLERRGLVLDRSWALGRNPAAEPGARLVACVLDWNAIRLEGSSGGN